MHRTTLCIMNTWPYTQKSTVLLTHNAEIHTITHTHTFTHIRMHTQTHTTHIHTQHTTHTTHTYANMHTHTHTHICKHAHTHTCTHTHTHATHTHTHICKHAHHTHTHHSSKNRPSCCSLSHRWAGCPSSACAGRSASGVLTCRTLWHTPPCPAAGTPPHTWGDGEGMGEAPCADA